MRNQLYKHKYIYLLNQNPQNLSAKSIRNFDPQFLSAKFIRKIYPQNLSAKFIRKIYPQNLSAKSIRNPQSVPAFSTRPKTVHTSI